MKLYFSSKEKNTFHFGKFLIINFIVLSIWISGCGQLSEAPILKGIKEIVQVKNYGDGGLVFNGIEITRMKYSKEGLLISIETDWKRKEDTISNKKIYKYENGKKKSESYYYKDGTAGEFNYYYYDSVGRLVKCIYHMSDSSVRRVDSFYYNNATKKRERYEYFPSLSSGISHTLSDSFNSAGYPVKEIHYYGESVDKSDIITYNSKGQEIKRVHTNFRTSNSGTTYSYYNKYGDPLGDKTIFENDDMEIENKITYTKRDRRNNWLSKQEILDGELFSRSNRVIYYY